jgi:hypothetical protein
MVAEREQLAVRAYGYLEAARIITSEHQRSPATTAPILHLVGHGIELLLKENLMEKGSSLRKVKAFNHDLHKLWNHEELIELRERAQEICEATWKKAKKSESFGDEFSIDPWNELQEYIVSLASLHGSSEGYPLRYIMKDGTSGPRPFLLLDTFGPLAIERLEKITGLKSVYKKC